MSETDNLSLEFLARGMERMLRENRDIREGQQELGRTLRALNETLVSINRTLSNLDRRISDVKDDLETTVKMEGIGLRNHLDDRLDTIASKLGLSSES